MYYGPKYSENDLLQAIDTVKDKYNTYEGTPQSVAQLLSENNIVAIYQGQSEAGPRALGNRSILYNPTDRNGKDFVNQVKGREWFRPFAGSILKEDASQYFDMAKMDGSPFMMYAVDVIGSKRKNIPSITHVDGTCRIQTVEQSDNKHYYDLINEFKKITGVPIVFNTSFNLAGEPLVETLYDAFAALEKSRINYLYIPEVKLLLGKK